ncbi:2-hydroxychromene-2-carboxylate isomerase [Alloalcanivorax xenomutans]|uniref:2-hydroxychromene-2-carboxylate isomerase n=1 Tax=Alloalcanivorax balearicus MACL04 TaxID=1177182 RepID=A0ABT2QY20_9GAMM|nr:MULTISPECIES: 2-hydroxychromene-2-carboxylate isomerase [Alloalcanivorax]MCU5782419.1 putative 2-hydroxychromene-2-carboxylate [Alloalcanivorax balearicus MACL04]SOC07545.1 2-hydroxychromene-2-carboxylate isomerase [Alloalcanivorax xenomutans]
MKVAIIDYYFWMNSDWAYLGADRLEALAERWNIRVRYRPVDLPDVYSRTGGQQLSDRSPERQAYRVLELKRWCRKLGISINTQPAFMCPNADLASCIVIAADRQGLPVGALYKSILHAQWCQDRDISSERTLLDILRERGVDGDRLISLAKQDDIVDLYRRYTDEAVAAGVFGSPSYVFQGELFWGQDRLEMLEGAIQRTTRLADS